MKAKMMAFFQTLSKAFLLPISFLSCGGLFVGISSILSMPDVIIRFPFLQNPVVEYINVLAGNAAGFMFDNLGLLFAISIAFFLAKEEREYAGFNAVVAYFIFNISMGCLVKVPVIEAMFPPSALGETLGYHTLKTGVLGGVIVGLLTAMVHNRTYNTKLPVAFGFFAGVRFVPIACTVFFTLFGQAFVFIWIPISNTINFLAHAITQAGVFGPFIYAFGERLLIPTGLHHIWNAAIRNTEVSGFAMMNGEYVAGVLNIYNKYLQTGILPDNMPLYEVCRFLRGGQIPITMFVLPAIGLAMYHTVPKNNRESVKSLFVSGIFTSFIAGITEPLEFAFLFVSPLLYIFYSVINGLSFTLVYILQTAVGGTEANIIGLTLFGIIRPDTGWHWLVVIGVVFAVICYFIFKWAIIKFDIKTPGRGGDYDTSIDIGIDIDDEIKKDPLKLKAFLIIRGLGGAENIETVDCCVSRLRVILIDGSKVDEAIIKSTGCAGIVRPDIHHIQIVYGTTVNMIKDVVRKQLIKK